MKLRSLLFASAVAGATIAGAPVALADPIVTDQWYTFGFTGAGMSLTNGAASTLGLLSIAAPDLPWTINLAAPAELVFTDGFTSGDQFEVLDFGLPFLMTSLPVQGFDCGNDELACVANANVSTGSFLLAAGAHSLTGAPLQSPFGGGDGFFIIRTAAVAEPLTLSLLGIGLAALGFAGRRRGQD